MMRCMAVQLRTAPLGFLSGWTAGALAGLRSMHRQVVHVTVPIHVDLAMPSWVDVHRSRWYSESDRTVRADGLVVATPMRMLWGLAAMCNQHRFDRAAEDAWHLGLITPAAPPGRTSKTTDAAERTGWRSSNDGSKGPPDAIEPPRAISSECCSRHWSAAGSQRRSDSIRSTSPRARRFISTSPGPSSASVSSPAPRGITVAISANVATRTAIVNAAELGWLISPIRRGDAQRP